MAQSFFHTIDHLEQNLIASSVPLTGAIEIFMERKFKPAAGPYNYFKYSSAASKAFSIPAGFLPPAVAKNA